MKIGDSIPNLEKSRIILNKEKEQPILLEGKPTFVHFWSFSCQICKQSLSDINFFREDFASEMNIISVHIPRSEQELQINLVKEQVVLNQIKHITIVDNQYNISDSFQNKFVPAFYLFDRNGTLIDFQAGELNKLHLEQQFSELLN